MIKKCLLIIGLIPGLMLNLVLTVAQAESSAASEPGIVSVGGSMTEILYALQRERWIVGVDSSSLWPKAATTQAQVGYMRNLSSEGILSLSPTLLLATHDAGPPAVIEHVKNAGIAVQIIADTKTPEGASAKIRSIAQTVSAVAQGEQLVQTLQTDLQRLAAFKASLGAVQPPRVLFLFSVTQGTVLASGRHTAADAMIQLAGGRNVFTGYDNFKPINSEALVTAAPEVLLVTDLTVTTLGGIEKLLALPGIALTPAGKNRRIIVMDTLYLLGFGPRLGQAALDLAYGLYSSTAAHD